MTLLVIRSVVKLHVHISGYDFSEIFANLLG